MIRRSVPIRPHSGQINNLIERLRHIGRSIRKVLTKLDKTTNLRLRNLPGVFMTNQSFVTDKGCDRILLQFFPSFMTDTFVNFEMGNR
jgi:hypothetical protein